MMINHIKVLSPQEALKISAGEVVERPASVVKETVENSIDAGATAISLYIEDAGKQLIRVVDNGCGMNKLDAKICFQNHSTSKIDSLEDLHHIDSFGFRGEALASISSICQVTLITKQKNADLGIHIDYENQTFIKEEACAAPQGTDLQIKNLFYNTPVRKKFLKQAETEWNQIQTLFHAFCLSSRHVHFKLYRDGKLILNAPTVESVKDRTSQIWGHNFSENLISVSQEDLQNTSNEPTRPDPSKRPSSLRLRRAPQDGRFLDADCPEHSTAGATSKGAKLSGFISSHNFWQYGRQKIFLFVNNRWIKNTELSKALLKGYRNVLPPARFPAAFLFIEINKNLVDINIHPRKEEVRFVKPGTVANTVQNLVTKTLEDQVTAQLGSTTTEQNINNIVSLTSPRESFDTFFLRKNTQQDF